MEGKRRLLVGEKRTSPHKTGLSCEHQSARTTAPWPPLGPAFASAVERLVVDGLGLWWWWCVVEIKEDLEEMSRSPDSFFVVVLVSSHTTAFPFPPHTAHSSHPHKHHVHGRAHLDGLERRWR